MFAVYCIEHKISSKRYYGKAKNYAKRMATHRWQVKNNSNSVIHRAIRLHGWEAFRCYVVDEFTTDIEAENHEIFLISENNTVAPYGYNLSLGGLGNTAKRIPEHLESLRLERIKVGECKPPSHKGKIMSQEQKDKIRNALLGKKKSDSHKRNLSIVKRGIAPPCAKYIRTKEIKRKTADTLRNKKLTIQEY